MERGFSAVQILLLVGYAVALAGGQVLFKVAALQSPAGVGWLQKVVALAFNPAFIVAIALYASLSAFWVWLLTTIPLSRAYPFVALAFMLTLLAGVVIFGEPLTGRLLAGGALILIGLAVITT
jgi:drug/metabolite transporter (DMT)-like permease